MAIDASKYKDIKYRYGASSFEECDCWGLVALIYRQELGIELDASSFYNEHPAHGSGSARLVIQTMRAGGLRSIQSLTPFAILLGYSVKSFGFGLWLGSEVLCCKSTGVHTMAWEQWKMSHGATVIFSAEDKHPITMRP